VRQITSAALALLLAGCGNAPGYKGGVASDCYTATSGQVVCPSTQRTAATPTYVYQTRPVYVPVPTYAPTYYGGGRSSRVEDLEDQLEELEDRIDQLEFEQLMRDD
jgi:TolA-binding protein